MKLTPLSLSGALCLLIVVGGFAEEEAAGGRLLVERVQSKNASGGVQEDVLFLAQQELKARGFYYGELDGKQSAATSAAIRRYQIRNGLDETGGLDAQTMESLGMGSNLKGSGKTEAVNGGEGAPAGSLDPVKAAGGGDEGVLMPEVRRALRPSPHPGGFEGSASGDDDIFAGTPYERAPKEVRAQTLRKAEELLAGKGVYEKRVGGADSGELEEAILAFQRRSNLPLSGRLDLKTLARLDLLPKRARLAAPPAETSQRNGSSSPAKGIPVLRAIPVVPRAGF